MTTHAKIVLLLLLVTNLLLIYHIRRRERVISDQRVYIEAGCRGRYQGEAP